MKMEDSNKIQKLKEKARWVPNQKQAIALARPEFEIGFGGARGGGKTDTGQSWLGYDSDCERLTGVVLRKNSSDLGEWIRRAQMKFVNDNIKATITGNPPVIKFPGKDGTPGKGATYFLGHFKDKNAFTKYQGQELQRILIEELELIPSEENYEALLASCRSTIPGIKAQVFSTFNPGGPGHTWIKRRFGLTGIPTKPIITRDNRTGRMRIFIPARVEDNPQLMLNDPDYVNQLNGLPDGLREQWRHGSWDNPIIKGAFYTLELEQMRREGRICQLPFYKEYGVHLFFDIGRDMTAVGFFQYVNGWWHMIDYYQNSQLGLNHYIVYLNEKARTHGYQYAGWHFPHDIKHKNWGDDHTTRESQLESANIDYDVVPDQSIDDGINAFRLISTRLKMDEIRCAPCIDALINYRREFDDEKQIFKKDPLHDWASHPADMMRYFAVYNHSDIVADTSASDALRRDIEELGGKKKRSAEFGGGQQGGYNRFHHGE